MQVRILKAVATFDDFTRDNDPCGEHDCTILSVDGHRVMFKIDYYDISLTYASDGWPALRAKATLDLPMMEVISMNTLFQALHIHAARRGDGLLPEFLALEYRAGRAPKVANEKAPAEAQQKEEPADSVKASGSP